MTPRDFAKALLRDYVLRGDPLEDIRRSGMGWYRHSYGWDAHVHRDHVVVRDMNQDWRAIGEYKVAELYAEIKAEAAHQVTQPRLFDDGKVTP